MKRNLALILMFVVFMAALTFVPVLAQKDNPPPAEETGKFIRMGERAIPGQYIVVLDMDVDGG